MAVVADAYDFTMSLIVLDDPPDRDWSDYGDTIAVAVGNRFRENSWK